MTSSARVFGILAQELIHDFIYAAYRYFAPVQTKRGVLIVQSLSQTQLKLDTFVELLHIDGEALIQIDPHLPAAIEFCASVCYSDASDCFFRNKERCGNLFVAASEISRFLAELCLSTIVQEGSNKAASDFHHGSASFYAREHWLTHLQEVAAIDEPLLELFRQASVSYIPDMQYFSDLILRWVSINFSCFGHFQV